MRILIVGSDSNYAIERPYLKYMAKNGSVSEAKLFAAQNFFLDYYKKSIIKKVLYRCGLSGILKDINNLLRQEIKSFKPNVILIFKGMEVFPETIAWIKELKIKVVNYNPDNPFFFSGRGSGNKNIRNSLNLYDLHITYHREVKEEIERRYSIPCSLIPFGFELSNQLYENCSTETEILKTCFLGNPDKFRARTIYQLASNGIEVDVYGNGWSKFISHPLVNCFNSVYGDEFWRTIRKYRIQLNIMRPHNPNSHNMRTFEIPAVGGIQLAPDTIDHRTYFDVSTEINLYCDETECVGKIKEMLKWPVSKADKMRYSARKRCVNSGYSYADRANEIVSELQKLISDQSSSTPQKFASFLS